MGIIFAYVLIYFLVHIVFTLAVEYEETEYKLRVFVPGKTVRDNNPLRDDFRVMTLFLTFGVLVWVIFLIHDLYEVLKSAHKRITEGEAIPVAAVFLFMYSALHMLITVYLECSSIAFVCSLALFVGGMYLAGKLLNALVDYWTD